MLKKLLSKLVDPRGPLGAVASPDITFKERAGLPIAAPISARASAATVNVEAVKNALAPPRVVGPEQVPPANRVQQVSRYVDERWAPIYAKATNPDDLAEVARLAQNPVRIGWRITQHVRMAQCDCDGARFSLDADGHLHHPECERPAPFVGREHADDFAEHVLSLQVQAMSDDAYNGIYATLGGKNAADPASQITKGRAEYRERTKDMIVWDAGTAKHAERVQAEQAAKKEARWQLAIEQYNKRQLPSRNLGEV